MINILEKELLNDRFIDNDFTNNINIKNKIDFNKEDIFYFGNYKDDKLNIILKKLIKNKKKLYHAIEKGTKIIVTGNSCNMFNNHFKVDKSLNLFNCYDTVIKKKLFSKENKIKNNKSKKIIYIDNLNNTINNSNFIYKNFCYIKDEKNISKIISKIKKTK